MIQPGPIVDGSNVRFDELNIFKEIIIGGFEIYLKVIGIHETVTMINEVANTINKE